LHRRTDPAERAVMLALAATRLPRTGRLTLKAQTRAALERVSTALPAMLPSASVLPLTTLRRRQRDANGDTPREDEASIRGHGAAKGAES
jgi:hypothetical protein